MAFDPADFAGTFLPQWPRLLMWYLIAHVVRSLFDLPWMTRILSSWVAPVGSSIRFISTAIGITQILNMETVLTLGLVAIWGLRRRKDWSRKKSGTRCSPTSVNAGNGAPGTASEGPVR
jgi:hypothetical protein